MLFRCFVPEKRQVARTSCIQSSLKEGVSWKQLLGSPAKQENPSSGLDDAHEFVKQRGQISCGIPDTVQTPSPVEGLVFERQMGHVPLVERNPFRQAGACRQIFTKLAQLREKVDSGYMAFLANGFYEKEGRESNAAADVEAVAGGREIQSLNNRAEDRLTQRVGV